MNGRSGTGEATVPTKLVRARPALSNMLIDASGS